MRFFALALFALAFSGVANAQTVTPPSGCVAGVACQAASVAVGGATIGTDALAVTGTSSFSGQLLAADGSAAAPSYSFGSDPDTGMSRVGANSLRLTASTLTITNAGGTATVVITPGPSGLATFGGDIVAGGSVTSGASLVSASTGSLLFGARSRILSGADGDLTFRNAGGTNSVTLTVGAANLLTLNGALTTGASVTVPSTSALRFGSRGYLFASADGVFLLQDNATTSVNRLQFGGTTSAFPSIQRSGAGLIARLADDSADTTVRASTVQTSVGYSAAGTPLPTCNAGAIGTRGYVIDAVAWTPAAAYVSGGSAFAPVICTGAAWFMN
jgi:hypothetical protein